jgi:hypothetical protein
LYAKVKFWNNSNFNYQMNINETKYSTVLAIYFLTLLGASNLTSWQRI